MEEAAAPHEGPRTPPSAGSGGQADVQGEAVAGRSTEPTSETAGAAKRNCSDDCIIPVDPDVWRFAVRVGVAVAVALFISLYGTPQDPIVQDPSFLIITVVLVSWFPSLQGSEIFSKVKQRVIGTIYGVSLGLAVGFIGITFPTVQGTRWFYFASISVITFVHAVVFNTVPAFKKYPYACLLSCFTFPFIAISFWNGSDPLWGLGVWRVIDIIFGSAIAIVVGMTIFPRPTAVAIRVQIHHTLVVTSLYFQASANHCKAPTNLALLNEIMLSSAVDDEMHQNLVKSLRALEALRVKIPMLKYSPYELYSKCYPVALTSLDAKEVSFTVARIHRILSVSTLIDSIFRNTETLVLLVGEKQLELFSDIYQTAGRLLVQDGVAIAEGSTLVSDEYDELERHLRLLEEHVREREEQATEEKQSTRIEEYDVLQVGAGDQVGPLLLALVRNLGARVLRFHKGCASLGQGGKHGAPPEKSEKPTELASV